MRLHVLIAVLVILPPLAVAAAPLAAPPLPLIVNADDTIDIPLFNDDRGCGFENAGRPERNQHAFIAQEPFRFSVRVPEGNYLVRLTLGDRGGESDTTVKAESRRLMLESVRTKPGETVTRSFAVNVRNAAIAGTVGAGDGGEIRRNEREPDSHPTWDDKLTLEFSGPRPCVAAIEIAPAPAAVTVFLAGDSTVTDQTGEPYVGWGQMLPRFFKPTLAVANHAESGRGLASFRGERRLDKILSVIKPGDYLFIQFGHNDQKDKSDGAGAFTTYMKSLEQYIELVKSKGATPVLVTPMYRRRFDRDGKPADSLGDFPAAVRQTAAEQGVAMIDLHEMSGRFFQSLGVEPSKQAFVHYPADTFPGQTAALKDDTHFNAYGGYEIARCVVEAIRTSGLPLAKELTGDVAPFDPAKPDAMGAVKIPQSLNPHSTKPEGN